VRPEIGQPCRQQANRRQKGADAIGELDAGGIREPAEEGAPIPPAPKANPKNSPATRPTWPGIRSCAKTRIAENAEARMKPMTSTRTVVQNRLT
jgi:hypothetical protein